jgi:Xaa-Pro aminopeptidase
MKNLASVQDYMCENNIDLWLLYDFRGSNDVLWQLLGGRAFTTRRGFLAVSQSGLPRALFHAIDEPQVNALVPDDTTFYFSRQEMSAWLQGTVKPNTTVAMEYSPLCAVPTLSIVDGGMLDVVRELGGSVVTSENLFQRALAVWDSSALASHRFAVEQVMETLRAALALVGSEVGNDRPLTEYKVQQFILNQFESRHLETDEVPVVSVNANSGRPHYMPSADVTSPIQRGDWLLIDLWARKPGNENIFADITWVASVGGSGSEEQRKVFDIVAGARDAAVARLQDAWKSSEPLMGWQVDDVAREFISSRGYGREFIHRTGHSIGPGQHLHALGVNIDNFETQDTRTFLPGVGFSIEPGIYLPEFGVRSEIDVYVDPEMGPTVTTPLQASIETITL